MEVSDLFLSFDQYVAEAKARGMGVREFLELKDKEDFFAYLAYLKTLPDLNWTHALGLTWLAKRAFPAATCKCCDGQREKPPG